MAVLYFALLGLLAGWPQIGSSLPHATTEHEADGTPSSPLAAFALQKVLSDATPIFGNSADASAEPASATWMRAYSDDIPIAHMNIPGTHDAATWNYSKATQQSLDPVTRLINISDIYPSWFRCQDKSFAAMLSAGIRVFDLRYAWDVTKTSLVFWHSFALQSETATVEDILFGFYNWLDAHPTEALFLSFQHEGGNDDYGTQMMLYRILTSPASQQYILQARGTLGTLGQARGKITLLRRFDLNLLPASFENAMPGLHFSPSQWTDNGPNISLVYNASTGATAYIEDYYQPQTPHGSSAVENIRWKLNATEAHLRRAASTQPDSLFWGFASSTNVLNDPADTPRIQALGNGTKTPNGGVNQQLVPFLKNMTGKRLGIMMFDFFEQPSTLIPLYLSLLPPQSDAQD